jgi:hypothetical protein
MRPSARRVGVLLGVARAGLGGTFLVAPTLSLQLLGVDTATARRMTWLARMTAGRDVALAAGVLAAAARGRGVTPWLAAGAAADGVDAIALGEAVRAGRLAGVRAGAAAGGAVAAALVALWAAAARGAD